MKENETKYITPHEKHPDWGKSKKAFKQLDNV